MQTESHTAVAGGHGVSPGFINFRLEGLEKLPEFLQFGHSVFCLLDHLCLRPGSELSSVEEVHGFYSRHGADPNCPFLSDEADTENLSLSLSQAQTHCLNAAGIVSSNFKLIYKKI